MYAGVPMIAPVRVRRASTSAVVSAALGRASLKDAVAEVADALGLPRREVYARALALTRAR